jgi:hypothetical protein
LICRQVNEADNTITPVEIPKAGSSDEATAEDNAPIKYEVNGDVERTTSGGREGTDLDPADQTLVGEVSVIQDISVSGVSALRIVSPFFLSTPWSILGFEFRRFASFVPFRFFCFRLPLLFFLSDRGRRFESAHSRLFLYDRMSTSRSSILMP